MNNMIPLHPFDNDKTGAVSLFESTLLLSSEGHLRVRYIVDTQPGAIKLPDYGEPVRTKDLWQSTCFELFLKEEGQEAYLEFNFAPFHAWAAYCFAGYRDGMTDVDIKTTPEIHMEFGDYWFALEASLQLPDDWQNKALLANITAILETENGDISYWAAAHSATKPDFHDPSCFVLPLRAGGTS
jgi:hypothetical protein